MNVEKLGFLAVDCKPRKFDFIKYSNDKYMMNKMASVSEICEKTLCDSGIVSLNFLA